MYFTTLTQVDNIPESSLFTYLETMDKYLLVTEYGKEGSNKHYHIILDPGNSSIRTDKITLKIRSLYNTEFLKTLETTKFLIKTKIAKNWKRLYSEYLIKEQHNKTFNSIKFKGFNEHELKKLYKTAGVNNLLRDQITLTITNAPAHIVQYLKDNQLDYYRMKMETILQLMAADGYIAHHLTDQTTISKIIFGVNALWNIDANEILRIKTYYKNNFSYEIINA